MNCVLHVPLKWARGSCWECVISAVFVSQMSAVTRALGNGTYTQVFSGFLQRPERTPSQRLLLLLYKQLVLSYSGTNNTDIIVQYCSAFSSERAYLQGTQPGWSGSLQFLQWKRTRRRKHWNWTWLCFFGFGFDFDLHCDLLAPPCCVILYHLTSR